MWDPFSRSRHKAFLMVAKLKKALTDISFISYEKPLFQFDWNSFSTQKLVKLRILKQKCTCCQGEKQRVIGMSDFLTSLIRRVQGKLKTIFCCYIKPSLQNLPIF